ncbi:FAD-dependent oxidoreductase [Nocardia jinanensis]|uniref:ferredoxin--NADP(+) reductase n=1 Tax=Nocardia jinanensis TaxID=382504 RepID=A0A917RKZ7_9NOCA|nr:FAD-dependent oxidoreductase [Nocardia jinanensis]GGL11470.1 ferredoxin [Nocardia jinanensis]
MTFVIAQGCCSDAACVSACPVDCIRPRPDDPEFMSAEQLYIDPDSCIDCAACMTECPVGAVYDENDMPRDLEVFREINAEYFAENPLEVVEDARTVRRRLSGDRPELRVAVVGSGPSGCYTVDQLSRIPGVRVTLIDRLPTPYGLVRAGVAPDHLATKDTAKVFAKVIRRPNVHCLFNVEVGVHVSIGELLGAHHAVVMATGADEARTLGIPGEELAGVHSARDFVAWYNGHPDHAGRRFDLSGERVVIIGNGNVALDAARLMVTDEHALEATDMARDAVEALRQADVREVVIAARRGVLDAAYTTPELLALTRMPGVELLAESSELGYDADDRRLRRSTTRRKLHVAEAASHTPRQGGKRIILRYNMVPVSLNGSGRVESFTFRRDPTVPDGNAELETLSTGLVLRAIGYRAAPIDGLPLNSETGTIAHRVGRIHHSSPEDPELGLYCVGWAKRGPSGVIGTNQVCAAETVEAVLDDFLGGTLGEPGCSADELAAVIAARQPSIVDHGAWLAIDAAEKRRAADSPTRPREKFVTLAEMLAAAGR